VNESEARALYAEEQNHPSRVIREHRAEQLIQNVPHEMQKKPQWVLWRYAFDTSGNLKKPPYYAPLTQPPRRAAVDDRQTWQPFNNVLGIYERGGFAGIGYILQRADYITAIDLDKCRRPTNGELAQWAQEIVDTFHTYTEISPSGRGLHLFTRGQIPAAAKRGHIEMYNHARYMTITGDILTSHTAPLRFYQHHLDALYHRLKPPTTEPAPQPTPPRGYSHSAADAQVLEKIKTKENYPKFSYYWNGGGDDKSVGDLALCSMLYYYTNGTEEDRLAQVDRLFRQSHRIRDKWDEQRGDTTYGQLTIETAQKRSQAYTQRRKKYDL
jgi:putative DNA primase/helicase